MHKLANAILFQACWFAAILIGWQAALLPLVVLALHGLVAEAGQHAYARLLLLACLGIGVDSALMYFGVYRFPAVNGLFHPLVPVWLMLIWLAFSLTLCSSLSWLKRWPMHFIVACGIFGPVSYAAGKRLHVIDFDLAFLPLISLLWLTIGGL